MSDVFVQECPECDWRMSADFAGVHADAAGLARGGLQWAWQVHAARMHPGVFRHVLEPQGYLDWLASEAQDPATPRKGVNRDVDPGTSLAELAASMSEFARQFLAAIAPAVNAASDLANTVARSLDEHPPEG